MRFKNKTFHFQIDANSHFANVILEIMVGSIELKDESEFQTHLDTARSEGQNGIQVASQTLKHFVDIGILRIKNTNPWAAINSKIYNSYLMFFSLMFKI